MTSDAKLSCSDGVPVRCEPYTNVTVADPDRAGGSALSVPSNREDVDRALTLFRRCGGALPRDVNMRKELDHDDEERQRFAELVAQSDPLLPSGKELELHEIDPTGAGDCFDGVRVAARRLGLAVNESLMYECASDARDAMVLGPMEGAGTRAELDHFIASTERKTLCPSS